MTAAARSTGGRAARAVARPRIDSLAAILTIATGIAIAAPAHAQVSGSISVESELRRRGYSISAGRPVATAQIGYDDRSGLYVNVSATGEAGKEDPIFLGVEGNIGYAKRVGRAFSVDAGIVSAQYRAGEPGGRPHNYNEVYLGFSFAPISARVYYSPDYYRSGVSTIYGELDGTIEPARNWRITGHVGSLHYLALPPEYGIARVTRYDWRLGLSRQLGNFEVHTALSGGGPGRDRYEGRLRGLTTLTAGASWSF